MWLGFAVQLVTVHFPGPRGSAQALGLMVDGIVLWNTIYRDVALNQLRAEGTVNLAAGQLVRWG